MKQVFLDDKKMHVCTMKEYGDMLILKDLRDPTEKYVCVIGQSMQTSVYCRFIEAFAAFKKCCGEKNRNIHLCMDIPATHLHDVSLWMDKHGFCDVLFASADEIDRKLETIFIDPELSSVCFVPAKAEMIPIAVDNILQFLKERFGE